MIGVLVVGEGHGVSYDGMIEELRDCGLESFGVLGVSSFYQGEVIVNDRWRIPLKGVCDMELHDVLEFIATGDGELFLRRHNGMLCDDYGAKYVSGRMVNWLVDNLKIRWLSM